MPNGGWGQPGQRETIARGERTDPRVIIGQAAGWAVCGMFVVLVIMAAIMLNVGTTWTYIGQNWKWLILFPILPWIGGAVLATFVLTIEIFDPNYPAPRDALPTTRILWPWSKERVQFPDASSGGGGRLRGQIDFSLGDDDVD